jgi:hypothetical protein
MLRIQQEHSNGVMSGGIRLHLVGQLRGQWVEELRRLCASLPTGTQIELDMVELSFVDAEGIRLLRSLSKGGATLVNCALFVAEQLRTLEQDV